MSRQPLHLCATTRLAQTLRESAPADQRVWRTPQALTLGQWLGGLAEEADLRGPARLPQVLTPFSERLLWEEVINDSLDPTSAPLFDISGMAAAAAEAHALCRVWRLQASRDQALADEALLFLKWQKAFLQRCQAGHWIDQAGQHLAVVELVENGYFVLPETIVFSGFDRHTPLEQRLIAALRAHGCHVASPAAESPVAASPIIRAAAYPDTRAECQAVAAWARDELARQPAARLGVVAPDLSGVRDSLAFLLDDMLHPAAVSPAAAEQARRYNFSLGRPLADIPLAATALALLRLAASRQKVEQSVLGTLLLGQHWSAADSEADDRARLDAAMRRDLPLLLRLPALLRLGQRLAASGPALCPRSQAALAALSEAVAALPNGRQPPGRWAEACRQLLAAVEWPGERPLSSHEYQAHQAFLSVIDSLATLEPLLGKIHFAEAVRRLGHLARERIFQPETRGEPNIQVLGVLESAGLAFDALWVMGMNDDQWPPAPRPNPLLPAELQRQAGSPHACAEVELDFARRVHARLLAAAPIVHFSWSERDGNRLRRASPLVAALPYQTVAAPGVDSLARRLALLAGAACEQLDDHRAPPLAEGETVRGGSWLLRAQAICPAWGFYQYRLGAEALKTAVDGLAPTDRGTLVHGALEAFWRTTGDSAALAAQDAATRQALVAQSVKEALDHFEAARHTTLPARFRQLEGERLSRLLLRWLDIEDKRSEAFTVVACEQQENISIEGIQVRMVVDRIDQLGDGRRLVIDYKTGHSIDVRNWAEDRLTEPQLPIYAALVAPDVSAVSFAKVLLDEPTFSGIAADGGLLPGVPGLADKRQKLFAAERFPDWTAVLAHWNERLHAIAREVREGEAAVCPSDEKKLLYCEVLPLLRLAERQRQWQEARAGSPP